MSIQTIGFRFNGIAPLLMHNGALANPLNPLVKEMKAITGLRKKTDEHHLELQWLEFRASLYLDAKGRVIVPSSNIEGTLVEVRKEPNSARRSSLPLWWQMMRCWITGHS